MNMYVEARQKTDQNLKLLRRKHLACPSSSDLWKLPAISVLLGHLSLSLEDPGEYGHVSLDG